MKVIGANFAKKVEVNTRGKNIALSYTDKNGKFRVIRVDKDLCLLYTSPSPRDS